MAAKKDDVTREARLDDLVDELRARSTRQSDILARLDATKQRIREDIARAKKESDAAKRRAALIRDRIHPARKARTRKTR